MARHEPDIRAADGPLSLKELLQHFLDFRLVTVHFKAGQKALKSATPPVPQTVETVKEDIQWAKNPTGSAPR